MITGSDVFDVRELADVEQEALRVACTVMIDQAFDDLAALESGDDFTSLTMLDWLPRKHLPRYNGSFARQFTVCLITVAWKLFDGADHRLACVAEEMALAALLSEAEAWLEDRGSEANVRLAAEGAFQDTDFELLFKPAYDGVEAADETAHLAFANLELADWFKPFLNAPSVHPYTADE
jgi:hypothetical protein